MTPRSPLLADKTAIVYGAAGPIGAGVARTFARQGVTVHLVGRTRATLDRVAERITDDGGLARVAVLDVLDERAVDAHVRAVARDAGGLDLSINLVRGAMPAFITARAAARVMLAQGFGVILTFTGEPAEHGVWVGDLAGAVTGTHLNLTSGAVPS